MKSKVTVFAMSLILTLMYSTGLIVNSSSGQESGGNANSYFVDAGLVKLNKIVAAEASLGQNYTCTITVTATTAVGNVVVNDEVPSGASFVESTPKAKESGNKLTWTIEKMAPGEEITISVTLKAERVGELTGCATISAVPICCVATFVGKAELTITKTGPEQELLGNDVSYAITVTNIGTSVAKNVKIVDDVPSSLTHSSGQSSLSFDVGDLAPNQSRSVDITFGTTKPGRVCNTAIANADNTDRVSAEACTVIVQQALEITKTGPKEQYLGKAAKYQIEVKNPGDVPLSNVRVIDIAPNETKILKAPDGQIDGNEAAWIIPQLAAGDSKTFNLVLTTDIFGDHCNGVTVSSAEGLTDESSACTLWKGYPALLLEVIDTNDPLQIGEQTTYIIKVTNQGTAADHNVSILARFPSETKPIKASGATRAEKDGKVVKFTAYPSLAPKETIEFMIETEAVSVGDSRLKVEMSSDLLRSPVNEEESTHVY